MLLHKLRLAICVLLPLILLGACTSVPDHVKYIPANANFVAGINIRAVSKEMAWSLLAGSDFFKKLQEKSKDFSKEEALNGLENCGIKWQSSVYLYGKNNNRYAGGQKLVALIPLQDMGKWETYITKNFTGISISKAKAITTAFLPGDCIAAWNNKLLVIMNGMETENARTAIEETDVYDYTPPLDSAGMISEISTVFDLNEKESLKQNRNFKSLIKEDHHVSIWINHEAMMSEGVANLGLSLSNSLWKNSASTMGFDFKKGIIKGEMKYYYAEGMKDVLKDFGSKNVDKELIDMLPAKNADVLITYHIAPKTIKSLVDKSGLGGFVTLALMQTGMSLEEMLDAFSGDMALCISDIKINKSSSADSLMASNGENGYMGGTPQANYIYALKIGKEENLDRLLQLALKEKLFVPNGLNMYQLKGSNALFVAKNKDYIAFAGTAQQAQDYLAGKFRQEEMPEQASHAVGGHPFGMYIDVKHIRNSIPVTANTGISEYVAMLQSHDLVSNIWLNGGEKKGSSFHYHMGIEFVNKNENSLLQLLDFAMEMDKIRKETKITIPATDTADFNSAADTSAGNI